MLALLEFVFWLLILPYVLFGMLLAHIAHAITQVFEPRLLLSGVWFGAMGAWLLPSSTPDDSRPFVSLVEMVAQSHIGPVPTPAALIAVAALLVIAAAVVAFRRRQRAA
ncbi:hypothetical protein [Xanthomonas translucens]|uniref:hypothetical protein n=1 Tax=Xanthomonas campestris pv. translucens TaxID=343 RepID=UPI00071E84FA|nr:hypothetical protein [Xanthomonas translucens]QSQ62218.1 hypothetical protein ISN38_19575 [Xanthomonas translucens pv. undulosa]UKE41842.1 hypothetical protein KCU58_20125 [Xanthomonas translucens pv. undulosa]UPU47152.1 hypothetical protein MZO50_00305 [Xanthomonas translucens pv. undulosa]UPU47188.1 hypothetical protein MZO50_00055 [Xanthomonas translucens pv. undulosa]